LDLVVTTQVSVDVDVGLMNAAKTYVKPKVSFGLNLLQMLILFNLQLDVAWKVDARMMNFVHWNQLMLLWIQLMHP